MIIEAHGNAVIVETEYHPASSLHTDVDRIIGKEINGIGEAVSVIGMRIPIELRDYDGDDLIGVLKNTIFEYFTKNKDGRFPQDGYLQGTLADLRAVVTLVSIPRSKIEYCVGIMEKGIEKITSKIEQADEHVQKKISLNLGDSDEDTPDMAALVLLNAGMFYEEIATHNKDIEPLNSLSIFGGEIPQSKMIAAWDKIMEDIDYIPIFQNAVDILRSLPSSIASEALKVMKESVSTIVALHMTKSGDVYGSLYQNMLSRRKNIAAYYTRPEAAALLAGLVMPNSSDNLWKNESLLKKICIADFACGSGMLLTHAYYHIKHCLDVDASNLHKHFMEKCFYGYDIIPTATQLTVSNLAGIYPDVFFDMTNIYTMPIGPTGNGYDLGSLDLIRDTGKFKVAGVQIGGKKMKSVKIATVKEKSCDFVLMNPPYARPTNHGGGRKDPVPPFAVFGIPPDAQIEMGNLTSDMFKNTCSHGNAGLATHFMAISDKKLKPGGKIGLILPNTLIVGDSWKKMRALINDWYDDVYIVIVGGDDGTYSSDTNINEVMLVAKKRKLRRLVNDKPRVTTVLLDSFPQNRLQSVEISKQINKLVPLKLEDATGYTNISLGNDNIGIMVNCPTDGIKWWVCFTQPIDLYILTYQLVHNMTEIPMIRLGDISELGPYHLDIRGDKSDGTPRGPFTKVKYSKNSSYSALWNNNHETQRQMSVFPDCSLQRKPDASIKHTNKIWNTATHVHINFQIRYSAQRLVTAYTKDVCVGGRSWPSVILDEKYEKAMMVWCNSIFGIISYWAISGFQQTGRGSMSKNVLKSFPVIDFRTLSKKQLKSFNILFDKLQSTPLSPIMDAHKDEMRRHIDAEILKILNEGGGGWIC